MPADEKQLLAALFARHQSDLGVTGGIKTLQQLCLFCFSIFFIFIFLLDLHPSVGTLPKALRENNISEPNWLDFCSEV